MISGPPPRGYRAIYQQFTGAAFRNLIEAKDSSILAHFSRPGSCLEMGPEIVDS